MSNSLSYHSDTNRKPISPLVKVFRRDWQLLVLCLIPITYFIIFKYIPMYGVQIAFKNFQAGLGITGSPWCGFDQFKRFFASSQFWVLIRNTLTLSFLEIVLCFPIPIILAILLNQTKNKPFKKFIQSITYCPHFISTVVFVSMIYLFLSPRNGLINNIINLLGGEAIHFLGSASWFPITFVGSGIWQDTGWSAIIYIAALTSISPDLYEAAQVDGASKWKIVRHIDIPGILPTVVMMLILQMGKIMSVGFQKAYLMQNSLNIDASEIISTYVYKVGLLDNQYSYSAAIGLINNIINIILLITVNKIAKKTTENSLW